MDAASKAYAYGLECFAANSADVISITSQCTSTELHVNYTFNGTVAAMPAKAESTGSTVWCMLCVELFATRAGVSIAYV